MIEKKIGNLSYLELHTSMMTKLQLAKMFSNRLLTNQMIEKLMSVETTMLVKPLPTKARLVTTLAYTKIYNAILISLTHDPITTP